MTAPRRTTMLRGRTIAAALLLYPAAELVAAPDVQASVANMSVLEQRIAETRAMGVFTKLSVKRDADKLHAALREHHAGSGRATLGELQERFNLLVQQLELDQLHVKLRQLRRVLLARQLGRGLRLARLDSGLLLLPALVPALSLASSPRYWIDSPTSGCRDCSR